MYFRMRYVLVRSPFQDDRSCIFCFGPLSRGGCSSFPISVLLIAIVNFLDGPEIVRMREFSVLLPTPSVTVSSVIS